MPTDDELTKILGWPGYRVYHHEIDEKAKTLRLWVRGKPGNRVLRCPSCGRRVHDIHEGYEREVRDPPCFEFQTAVIVELYRIRCPDCGVKAEKVEPLPSKAPYSQRFEDAVGLACESAAARQVARRMGLAESTVRAIDLRYLDVTRHILFPRSSQDLRRLVSQNRVARTAAALSAALTAVG